MATRATYDICGTHFYCHWDGYPAGAAMRFANMVEAMTRPDPRDDAFEAMEDRRGGAAYAFIRGNLDAEPTKGRDAHGDTEFHYSVEWDKDRGQFWVGTFRRTWDEERFRFDCNLHKPLALWVNTQRDPAWGIPTLVEIEETREYGSPIRYVATEDHAKAIATKLRARGEGFQPDNPNRKTYLARADAWDAALGVVPA